MYVCMYVCMCARKREREMVRVIEWETVKHPPYILCIYLTLMWM